MTDDDRLDPVLVDRFRALDDVVPPDTWPGGVAPGTSGTRRWPLVAAAAAAVLILGSIVVLSTRSDDEGSIVGAPVTSASSTITSATTTVTSVPPTVYVVENALAVAEPAVVAPGEQVTITPQGVADRMCLDVVDVYAPGDDVLIGQISGTRDWSAVVEGGPPPTWLACLGETTAAPLAVTVPPVVDGTYRFCIAVGAQPEGCAAVTVVTTGDQPIEPTGTATPASAVPGQLVSIAPTRQVLRACTGVVSVHSWTTYLGSIAGPRLRPSPGEGDTMAACEGEMSDAPIEVAVPDLPPGRYAFCVSADLIPDGCASVDVLPSPLLATVTSREVANGDTITITPAGEVPRMCADIVRVYDVTRTVPVGQVVAPATGESAPPLADGSWDSVPGDLSGCTSEPSDRMLTMVVPDIGMGAYAFCLSADLEDASCALVYVVEKRFDPPAASTVAPPAGAIVVGDGGFVGLQRGPTFADADEFMRANTVEITAAERPGWACGLGFERIWLTRLGGLTIVWEGDELETAFGPNWRYDGGPVIGSDVMVTDRGITVGSTRQSVVDAYGPDAATEDPVFAPGFRIGFDGTDNVTWLGDVQCND